MPDIYTTRSSCTTYLAQTCREDDDFVDFAHLLQEVVHAWSLDDVDVVPVVLNFNRHDVVCLRDGLHKTLSVDGEVKAYTEHIP